MKKVILCLLTIILVSGCVPRSQWKDYYPFPDEINTNYL